MALRSTYFIDPTGVVRAVTSYPHNVGRSADEMLRLVAALKAVDTTKGFAPEGWQPGARLLVPPPDGNDPIDPAANWFCRYQS